MTMKSIVVVASGEPEDADVISAAAKLAVRFESHVCVVPAFPDPAADLVYYGTSIRASSEAADRIAASERVAQERLEVLAREIALREGLGAEKGALPSVTVERRALAPAVALAPAAVLADLVLFGREAARSVLAGLFAETLLSTRAPTLLIQAAPLSGGPVAVAWDGSAQAGRAARAALPLLQAATGVLILRNVDDESAEADAGAIVRLETYLARHGVTNVATRQLRGAQVSTSLLEAAKADKCEVLIAGAYGRPRLFEMILGGTTRALVNAAGAPHLLLAH